MKLHPVAQAIALSLVAFSAQAEHLSLQDAINKAWETNPNIEAIAVQVEQAEAALAQAKSSRMPIINASLNLAYTNHALNVFGLKLSQREASFGDFGFADFVSNMNLLPSPTSSGDTAKLLAIQPKDLNEADPRGDINPRLEVLIPVYNGGKISAYQDQASAYVSAAKSGTLAAKQQIGFYVLQAYEGVHTADSFIQVTQKGLEAATAYVKTTDNLVKQGVLVKNDLLTAQVHQSSVEIQMTRAKNQKELALAQLRMLVGLAADTPLELDGAVNLPVLTGSLASLQEEAIANNPELHAMKGQLDGKNAAVQIAAADGKVSFNMMARLDTHDDGLDFDAPAYTLGGALTYRISDFGVTARSVDMAQADARSMAAKIRAKEDEIKLQVLTAYRNIAQAQQEVESQSLNVTRAEEAQRLAKQRYDSGVSTLTELLAVEAQLNQARAELVKAQYDRSVERAKMYTLTGRMDLSVLKAQ